MQSKTLKTILIVFIALVVVAGSFAAGIGTGYSLPKLLGRDTTTPCITDVVPCPDVAETETCPGCPIATEENAPEDLQALFSPFWEVWNIVHQDYVDQPVDDVAMMRGAITGMLDALGDKHTSYMDPKEFEQANTSLEGEYEGIGAWVDITGDYVEIISPMKGSPAEAAGLRPKDSVVAIDGEDMTGIPGELVLQKILGPKDTSVTLTILREAETFDVTITRAHIIVPTVEYEMLEGNVAYISLSTFNEYSTPQLRAALTDLLSQKPVGLIFDLRYNGGGYLSTAIEIASEFIPKGIVMYEEYGDGSRDPFEAYGGGLAIEIPLVVLVNEGTASASEIVAGAIQDLGRGTLVGTVTYGKGTVQNWIILDDNQGGVRVTIARWLTPNGNQISEIGLTPEYIVEITDADYDNEIDPQLDKAIELLTQN
ncbi:MAG: S41 family peptidase [Anaerolineaceae bacterium]|nr:S41 family peptidase [Anaerolineaceae bacterium]